jgi:hypothetical protein
MSTPLPGITYQRRKQFRPTQSDVIYAYNIINKYIFENQLKRPEIKLGIIKKAWGICSWEQEQQPSGSYCYIRLMDKWFCVQWFLQTLAHEMVHQYQWDIYRWDHLIQQGRPMYDLSGAHGPSFYAWRDKFAEYDMNLKVHWSQRKWFKYQDFTKA